MFVVRIRNDEATLFRAFRRLSAARRWADAHNAEDVHVHLDILDVSGAAEVSSAVTAARSGQGTLVHRIEAAIIPAWIIGATHSAAEAPADHAFA